jgi:branched-chain amino acid transport system substrate-binding protein
MSRTRRVLGPLVGILAATAAALVLGACGGDDDSSGEASAASDGEPFKVLMIAPTSGPQKVAGDMEVAGAEAAVAQVNEEGGILGHKVTLTVEDDGGDGNRAVSVAQEELAAGDEYNMVIPGITAVDAPPLAAALAAKPILQITTASENVLSDPDKYPNLYSSSSTFRSNAAATVEQLEKDGITKAAFISGDAENAHDTAKDLKELAGDAGIEVAADVYVPTDAPDATPQMQQALASNPEALVSGSFTLATGAIVTAASKLAPDVPFYGDPFFSSADLSGFVGADQLAKLNLATFPYLVKDSTGQDTPEYRAFAAQVAKLVSKPAISLHAAVVSYNAIMLGRAAAQKADAIDGAAMAKSMAEVGTIGDAPGFVGPEGAALFSPDEHITQLTGDDFVWVKGGPVVNGVMEPAQ